MSAVKSALVIGGGIAGSVVATALKRAGIDAAVYEAYPNMGEGIGGDIALAANGLQALSIIGADDPVRATSLPISGQTMSINGRDVVLMPTLDGVEPMRIVARGDLHAVLRDRALEAGVPFHYSKQLVRAESTKTGITAEFNDGTTATADILIGADGVRSVVRTLIDENAPPAGYTGLLGFQATVHPNEMADAASAQVRDLEPGAMVFAFGHRAYYLYWKNLDGSITWGANLPSKQYLSTSEARAIPSSEWLKTLRETYAGDTPGEMLANGTTEARLEVLGAIHIMPPVPHWYRDHMVLVGDAVHAPSNSTGQGGSLAIESAIQLARCLRDLSDAASAFAAYESLRRARVEKITKRGAQTNQTKTPGPVARKMMQAVMPVMMKLMNFEKTMGPEQRYVIDWDAPATGAAAATPA